MSEREIRVSPDGDMVAVRTDWPDDAWNAWAVTHALHGGHWSDAKGVEGWNIVTATEAAPAPEPVPVQEFPILPDMVQIIQQENA